MSVRDTGILRKRTNPTPNLSDLVIIGYQSRIFDDDEKALYIDQGSHLIGWMGNESLKIDRYDVRATLSDLTPFEAPPGGYSNRLSDLTPAEQKAEQLCEEERYYSLHTNEIEEEAYQEEILKRQKVGYGQVGFNYDGDAAASDQLPQHGPEEATDEQEPDDPFEAMPNFEIPRHIEPPDTMRLNAIIEKTARFIAQQGVQMEILIKAKQSNNPQFDFLNMNGRCNLYYKLLVEAIKEGRYPDRVQDTAATQAQSNGRDTDKKKRSKEHANGNAANTAPVVVPVLKYIPSEDCAYTQLISKIKGKSISEIKSSTPEPVTNDETTKAEEKERQTIKPVIDFKHKSSSVEVKKISSGLMLAQCYNSDSEEGDSDEEDSNNKGEADNAQVAEEPSNDVPSTKTNLEKLDVPVPPEDLRTIVDKTAAYVAKNGKDFEDILRTRKDPRFAFLDATSQYHRYYIYMVTGTIYIPATTPGSSPVKNGGSVGAKEKPVITVPPPVVQPVSFTIKPLRKDEAGAGSTGDQLPVKSDVRLDDDSSGEEVEVDDDSLSVADLLEREERKEIRRVEERVRDKLAAAAREKLGLVSKEKQLQQERRKKAMEFLLKIKKTGSGEGGELDEVAVGGSGTSTPLVIVDVPATKDKEDDRQIERRKVKTYRERQSSTRRSRSRTRSRSPYRSARRRSRSRSKSKSKKKRKRRSTDRERRRGEGDRKSKKSSRRRRSSSSDASRGRSRSRSRSRRSRERSRNR